MKLTAYLGSMAILCTSLHAGGQPARGQIAAQHELVAGGAFSVQSGSLTVQFNRETLDRYGLHVLSRHGEIGPDVGFTLETPLRPVSEIEIDSGDSAGWNIGKARIVGQIGFQVSGDGVALLLAPIELRYDKSAGWFFADSAAPEPADLRDHWAEIVAWEIGPDSGQVRLAGDWFLSIQGARHGAVRSIHLASFTADASLSTSPQALADPSTPHNVGSATGGIAGVIGPDLVVDQIGEIRRWGRVEPVPGLPGITGYSLSTKACNIGDQDADWFGGSPNKPVIAQNMYRLKDGRIEQIGMSWVKHAFLADDEVCTSGGTCVADPMGQHLGPNCGDTYFTFVNGDQLNLGPRYEVNPTTGVQNVWPPDSPGWKEVYSFPGDAAFKRIQVADADIDPDLNPGALYFVEAQYISPDESAAGNQDNNASYAPALEVVESAPHVYDILGPASNTTVIGHPGIMIWEDQDPTVTTLAIDIPGDRRVYLAYKVTDLGGGLWHYEYAIQNLNSDRAVGSFTVPVSDESTVTNIGFHDIDSHSGDDVTQVGSYYSNVDWPGLLAGGAVTWAADAFSVDDRANAIHWGTLYNFRFDSTLPPQMGEVTLGLFKPGTPAAMTVSAMVPGSALTLFASDPPDGAIDARQPSGLDGTNATGWDRVVLTFSGSVAGLTPADFTVTQVGGTGPAPGVLSVTIDGPDTVTVVLDAAIEVGAWTTIAHSAGAGSVTLGYLPGDVNADAVSAPSDILAVIDALNGVGPPRQIWSTDTDRSGVAGPEDILRVIDLLNGASAFEPFLDRTLP
ncbi:MAG: hypothetical protein ACE5E5_09985 [Phycisphaerae bacterium]